MRANLRIAIFGLALTVLASCASEATTPNYTPLPSYSAACCRVCIQGKACGDTCISRQDACHVGRGCACNG